MSVYRKALEAMPRAQRQALMEGSWADPPKPIGLRSHGLVESKWIPPKGRFVSLEAKDESWARYFGLGTIETRPMELYDVRDWNNKLIGYSGMNPANCRNGQMLVAVLEDADAVWPSLSKRPERFGDVKSIQVYTRLLDVKRERFICWLVRIDDAESLARGGWLKCIGQDRLEEFCWDLRRQAYERRF